MAALTIGGKRMFGLYALINKVAGWLGFNMNEIWRHLAAFLGKGWSLALIVVGIVFWLVTDAVGFAVQLSQWLAVLVVGQFNLAAPASIANALSIANTFFPLTELCVFLIAYAAVISVLFAYRALKSLVPTWGSV